MRNLELAKMPELLTTEDCASVLCVSRDTVWAMCKRGELPSVKLGRRWYVPKAQLMERIESMVGAR